MAVEVDVHEAGPRLPDLVERAQAGEDVVIDRDGSPAVRLVPVASEGHSPAAVRGVWRGQVFMAEDFDAPPEGFPDPSGAR